MNAVLECLLLSDQSSPWAVLPYSVAYIDSSPGQLCHSEYTWALPDLRPALSTDIYSQTVSEIEDPLFFGLKPNPSLNQFFRDSEILNNPAINVRRREQPNASKLTRERERRRINSAVCWSSSLRKQRSLAAAPIACRRAPYEQEQFSGHNLEDLQLEKNPGVSVHEAFQAVHYEWIEIFPEQTSSSDAASKERLKQGF